MTILGITWFYQISFPESRRYLQKEMIHFFLALLEQEVGVTFLKIIISRNVTAGESH
jgi:hypothetical protein